MRAKRDSRAVAQHFNPPGIWQPFGAFSLVVAQGEGQVLHLKGQVALDREGRVVGPGDMAAQLRQVLENIRTVLASVGGRPGDVISLTHYTTDIEAFMACGAVRAEFFAEPYPVTTTVEVRRLYRPEFLIEIAAIAQVPKARFRAPVGSE